MATYKMTLIGIEKWLEPEGKSVFDKLQLPEGINKSLLVDNIIMQAEEKELLYSEPDFLTDAISIWSRKNYWTFEKWVKAINIEYDPLYNYDRTEEWTDDHIGSDKRDKKGTYKNEGIDKSEAQTVSTMENKLQDKVTYDTNVNVDQTVTEQEAAFNSSSYENKIKTDTDGDTKTTGTTIEANTGTSENTGKTNTDLTRKDNGENSNSEEGSDEYKNTHKGRMYGNIGVTTSQQMLQSELELALWNLYDQIADLFISEFCIMVY